MGSVDTWDMGGTHGDMGSGGHMGYGKDTWGYGEWGDTWDMGGTHGDMGTHGIWGVGDTWGYGDTWRYGSGRHMWIWGVATIPLPRIIFSLD